MRVKRADATTQAAYLLRGKNWKVKTKISRLLSLCQPITKCLGTRESEYSNDDIALIQSVEYHQKYAG